MQIGENLPTGSTERTGGEVRDTSPAKPAESAPATTTDQTGSKDVVTLGEGSELLQQAFELGSAGRESRVAEVRQRLQQGTYHVDTKELSQAMIRHMLAMDIPTGSNL